VLSWHLAGAWQAAAAAGAQPCLLHQADWLACLLHGEGTLLRGWAVSSAWRPLLLLPATPWRTPLARACLSSQGLPDVSDWNNALKLGFDPAAEAYPEWLSSQVCAPDAWTPACRP
jgi:hypothetical protein